MKNAICNSEVSYCRTLVEEVVFTLHLKTRFLDSGLFPRNLIFIHQLKRPELIKVQ